MSRELNDIKANMLKEIKIDANKKTVHTPFGEVSNTLNHIQHLLPMKKGEILAQVIKKKISSKKDSFVWMGLVERYEWNPVWQKYIIFYRPFTSQLERFEERREHLFRKQWKD